MSSAIWDGEPGLHHVFRVAWRVAARSSEAGLAVPRKFDGPLLTEHDTAGTVPAGEPRDDVQGKTAIDSLPMGIWLWIAAHRCGEDRGVVF